MSRTSTAPKVVEKQIADKKALQELWEHLELKPATLLHLQEVLDTAGVASATKVTEALVREKGKEGHFSDVGKEWGSEALRSLSLEGMRPHLIDLIRVLLESCLAWHLISLPEGALDTVVQVILAVLFLVMSLGGICMTCWFRAKIPKSK